MDDLRGHLTPKVVHSSPDLPRPGQTTYGDQRSVRCGERQASRSAARISVATISVGGDQLGQPTVFMCGGS